MSEEKKKALDFDPYAEWLGISISSKEELNHFRLLRLSEEATDPEQIAFAAQRANEKIRKHSLGQHGDVAEKLLNEISRAEAILTNPAKRGKYLERVKQQNQKKSTSSSNQVSSAPKETQRDDSGDVQHLRSPGSSGVVEESESHKLVSSKSKKKKLSPGEVGQTSPIVAEQIKTGNEESLSIRDLKTDVRKTAISNSSESRVARKLNGKFLVAASLGVILVSTIGIDALWWSGSSDDANSGDTPNDLPNLPTIVEKDINEPPIAPITIPTELSQISHQEIRDRGGLRMFATTIAPKRNDEEFSLKNAPSGMTIDSTSGRIVWQPTDSQQGDFIAFVVINNKLTGSEIDSEKLAVTVKRKAAIPSNPRIRPSRSSYVLNPGQGFTNRVTLQIDPDTKIDDYELRCEADGLAKQQIEVTNESGNVFFVRWKPVLEQFGETKKKLLLRLIATYTKNPEIRSEVSFSVHLNPIASRTTFNASVNGYPIVDLAFDNFSNRLLSYDQNNQLKSWKIPQDLLTGKVREEHSFKPSVAGNEVSPDALQWMRVIGIRPMEKKRMNFHESKSVLAMSYYAETNLKDNRKEVRTLLGILGDEFGDAIRRFEVKPGAIPDKERDKQLENFHYPEMFNDVFLMSSNKKVFAFRAFNEDDRKTVFHLDNYQAPNIGFVWSYNWFAEGPTTISHEDNSIVHQGLSKDKSDNVEIALKNLPWKIREGGVVRALEFESTYGLLVNEKISKDKNRLVVFKNKGRQIVQVKSENEFVDIAFASFMLIAGDNSGKLTFYDFSNSKNPQSPILELQLGSASITRIVSNYNSGWIAVGFSDGTIQMVNTSLLNFEQDEKTNWSKRFVELGDSTRQRIVGSDSYDTRAHLLKMLQPFYATAIDLDSNNQAAISKLRELSSKIEIQSKKDEIDKRRSRRSRN